MLTDKNASVNKRCIFSPDIGLKPLVDILLHFLLCFYDGVKLCQFTSNLLGNLKWCCFIILILTTLYVSYFNVSSKLSQNTNQFKKSK